MEPGQAGKMTKRSHTQHKTDTHMDQTITAKARTISSITSLTDITTGTTCTQLDDLVSD